jgi:prepilin-type N-terminal cleavage/methylation domain-containing protein
MMTSHVERVGQRGWTLIELATVLALTSILSAMAWPSVDGLVSRLVLRSTSMTVIETLRTVRHRAMTEGKSYEVVFDPVDGECRVSEAGGALLVVALPDQVRFGAASGVLGPPSAPAKPPPSTGVTFQQAKVRFLPDGTLSPGPGTIYLTGRSGRPPSTVAISINIAGHLRRYLWDDHAWRMM